jgi:hypothetical protein
MRRLLRPPVSDPRLSEILQELSALKYQGWFRSSVVVRMPGSVIEDMRTICGELEERRRRARAHD